MNNKDNDAWIIKTFSENFGENSPPQTLTNFFMLWFSIIKLMNTITFCFGVREHRDGSSGSERCWFQQPQPFLPELNYVDLELTKNIHIYVIYKNYMGYCYY